MMSGIAENDLSEGDFVYEKLSGKLYILFRSNFDIHDIFEYAAWGSAFHTNKHWINSVYYDPHTWSTREETYDEWYCRKRLEQRKLSV
jgi:hypothetical protein